MCLLFIPCHRVGHKMPLRNLWCSFNSFYFIAEAHIHYYIYLFPICYENVFLSSKLSIKNCLVLLLSCSYYLLFVIPLWSSWSVNVLDLIPPQRFCFSHNSLLQSYHGRLLLSCPFQSSIYDCFSISVVLSLALSSSLCLLFVLGSLHTLSWFGFLTHTGTENLCSLRYATASARTDGMFLLCGGRDASGTVSKLFI